MIIRLNSDRDEINQLELAQFVRDTSQELIHFLRDKFNGQIEDEATQKGKKVCQFKVQDKSDQFRTTYNMSYKI